MASTDFPTLTVTCRALAAIKQLLVMARFEKKRSDDTPFQQSFQSKSQWQVPESPPSLQNLMS